MASWQLYCCLISSSSPARLVPLILLAADAGLYATSEESLSRILVIRPVIQHIHLFLSPHLLLLLLHGFFFLLATTSSHFLPEWAPSSSSPGLWPSVMTPSQRLKSISTLKLRELNYTDSSTIHWYVWINSHFLHYYTKSFLVKVSHKLLGFLRVPFWVPSSFKFIWNIMLG